MDEETFRAAARAIEWEKRYRERPDATEKQRWFLPEIDHLDPDFAQALDDHCPAAGSLLEIGCGSGSQAIEYARRGYRVTATDVSEASVAAARELAARSGVAIDLVCDNIAFTALDPGFDIICDRGCLTVLDPAIHARYVASVGALIAPGGLFLIKADRKKEALFDLFSGWSELGRMRGVYGGDRRVRSVMAIFRR